MRTIIFSVLLFAICYATYPFIIPYLIPADIITYSRIFITLGLIITGFFLFCYFILCWIFAYVTHELKYFKFPLLIALCAMGERCYVGYVACQATTSYAVFENTSFRAPYYFYQGNLDQADQYIDTLSDAVYDPRLRFPVALQEADKNIARIMAYSVYLVSKYKQVFVKLGILPKRPQLSKEALWQHTIGLYQKCVAYALQAPPSDQAQTKHDCDTATQGFINALKTTTFFGASASN